MCVANVTQNLNLRTKIYENIKRVLKKGITFTFQIAAYTPYSQKSWK